MADRREGNGDERHPFGPGSHRPLSDIGEMPTCYPIKATTDGDRRVYHRPDSAAYGVTRAEVWFDSPTMAEDAGFELASSHPEGSTGESFEPGGDDHPCTGQHVELNRLTAQGKTVAPAVGEVTGSADADGADERGDDGVDDNVDDGAEGAPRPGQLAADPDRHPYGIGSHSPLSEVSEMPRFYPVKGRVDSDGARWYHRPDSSEYRAIEAAVWFDSPSAAEAAGFELAATHPAGSSGADFEPGGSDHGWTLAEVEAARRNALTGELGTVPLAARQRQAPDTAGALNGRANRTAGDPPPAGEDLDADADGEAVASLGDDADTDDAAAGDVGAAADDDVADEAAADDAAAGDVGAAADDDVADEAAADDAAAGDDGAAADDDVGDEAAADDAAAGDDGAADDDAAGGLGAAAAGGAAAAAVAGAAALSGRDDGPGLPDLEEAATDVAHSRIVGESADPDPGELDGASVDSRKGSGGDEVTAPSPAGARGADDALGEVTSPSPAGRAGVGAATPAGAGAAVGGPNETVKVADGGPTRPASTTGELGASSVGRSTTSEPAGIGRLVWAVAGSVALIALLAFLLSQCGGTDAEGTAADGTAGGAAAGDDPADGEATSSSVDGAAPDDGANLAAGGGSEGDPDTDWTVGASDDGDTGGSATDADADGGDSSTGGTSTDADDTEADTDAESDPAGDDGAAAAGSDTSAADDDTGASGAAGTASDTELQALALATLEDAGLGDLDVEIEDGVIRLVGDVESQADADAAVAAIEGMAGMGEGMAVESALVVDAAADDGTSGPEPVEDEPPLTG